MTNLAHVQETHRERLPSEAPEVETTPFIDFTGIKASLLLVLKHPELPLHNNSAELAARFRVRKRDISFGPRTEDGQRAWDTFMTLAATTKKLGISFHEYIRDRITKKYSIPPLAELIRIRAKELNLGWSYSLA